MMNAVSDIGVEANVVTSPVVSLPVQERKTPAEYECFVGVSAHVAELKKFVATQAARSHLTLLIGERGLRQDQIARAIHERSPYSDQPFIAINAHLMTSEALYELLFGKLGVFKTCQQGTIFLNELTRLPSMLQQRFAVHLDELQWRERANRCQQHLILATEYHPEKVSAENRIAYGLVEQLRPYSFYLKPLRERREDIVSLAQFLLARLGESESGCCDLTPGALEALTAHNWEANICELEAILKGAVACMQPHLIDEDALPARIRYSTIRACPPTGIDLPKIVDDFEWTLIQTALQQTRNNQTKAAKLLGLRVQTLNMKIKRFLERGETMPNLAGNAGRERKEEQSGMLDSSVSR